MKGSILVLALTLSVPAFADQNCKPVDGHFLASVVPPGVDFCPNVAGQLCTAGRVWGGIQGDYQFVAAEFFPSAAIGGVPTILFFTGHSDVKLQSGDHIFGTDTGSIDLPPGAGGFASLITFSGGTREMSTSHGQIRLRGEFSATAGTTSGDYTGSICSN
jgi:hypothetical protein